MAHPEDILRGNQDAGMQSLLGALAGLPGQVGDVLELANLVTPEGMDIDTSINTEDFGRRLGADTDSLSFQIGSMGVPDMRDLVEVLALVSSKAGPGLAGTFIVPGTPEFDALMKRTFGPSGEPPKGPDPDVMHLDERRGDKALDEVLDYFSDFRTKPSANE